MRGLPIAMMDLLSSVEQSIINGFGAFREVLEATDGAIGGLAKVLGVFSCMVDLFSDSVLVCRIFQFASTSEQGDIGGTIH
jgi:hypothetical protein